MTHLRHCHFPLKSLLLVVLLLIILTGCRESSVTISNQRCEYLTDPLGIDEQKPRLSWQLQSDRRGEKQTGYHLIVSSSREKLDANSGDLWDTRKVRSDQSVQVVYDGIALQSRMTCFWKVRVWDQNGRPSAWSEPASWSMGLLAPEEWTANWIGTPEAGTAPYYRKTFTLDTLPATATIYVAALGYFELFVNGQKVGNEVLAPAVSNYSKRSYYRTYDISGLLTKGRNSLGIWMGTGWYSPGLPGVKHHSPVIRAQLEFEGAGATKRLVTDTSWVTSPSDRKLLGTWRWGDFGGEQVDARISDPDWWQEDLSAQNWVPVVVATVADVPCTAQPCRGNTGFAVIKPQTIEVLDNETILVDFGTNLTGMMQLNFRKLKPGHKIAMYFADFDGRREEDRWRALQTRKDFAVYGQWDEFISAGAETETFRNVFNYHAFRYVLIEGLPYLPDTADIAAVAVETEGAETGTFRCSNELYNRIHTMVRWTYRCLNLGGQTVDCPHRERLGYGDGQTIMDLGCYNFDAVPLYAKWSRNWWDEQGADGFVPFTAPCPHTTGGGPAWGAMCIMVPWKTYLFANDRRLLEEGYPAMKKYTDYLQSYCKDGLLQDIFPGERWPNLGDWVPPGRGMDKTDWVGDSPRRLFNNCYRVHLLQIMQKVAGLIGIEADVNAFEQEIAFAQQKIHEAWYNPHDSTYAGGEQPYQIFPLMTGVTPENLKKAVFEKYEETLLVKDSGHLNTGMIGTQIMTDYLLEIDRNDLIDVFVNKKTHPGWGYMVEKGATTCWEQWNGYFSQIHSCFPYIGGWFYRGLAGIRWDPENPGFRHIILRPALVESVNWVDCRYSSPYGEIISNWKIDQGTFSWSVRIPPNTVATVWVPGTNIRESGQPAEKAAGVKFLRNEAAYTVYSVESGSYTFTQK
jgi:alpha-L-rhamnosidase